MPDFDLSCPEKKIYQKLIYYPKLRLMYVSTVGIDFGEKCEKKNRIKFPAQHDVTVRLARMRTRLAHPGTHTLLLRIELNKCSH